MDELETWEAREIIKNLIYLDRNQREMDRYKLYVAVQANSKHKIDIENIMKLPWDKSEQLRLHPIEYNEEEERELADRAKQIETMMKSGALRFAEDKNILHL